MKKYNKICPEFLRQTFFDISYFLWYVRSSYTIWGSDIMGMQLLQKPTLPTVAQTDKVVEFLLLGRKCKTSIKEIFKPYPFMGDHCMSSKPEYTQPISLQTYLFLPGYSIVPDRTFRLANNFAFILIKRTQELSDESLPVDDNSTRLLNFLMSNIFTVLHHENDDVNHQSLIISPTKGKVINAKHFLEF